MENKNDLQKWIDLGAEVVGSSLSGTIGLINPTITGVIEATAGGILITKSLQTVGKELWSRQLSKREEKRIGSAFYYLKQKFDENIDAGKTIRDDSFFDVLKEDDSKGNEILEGVLLAAQKSYQEKKVRHISFFCGNIIFDKEVDSYEANHFLKLAEAMSYRQFCLLAVYYYASEFELDKGNHAPVQRNMRVDTISDLIFLRDQALIKTNIPINNDGRHYLFPPENAYLTVYGNKFCELFNLDQILGEDLLEVANHLVTEGKVEEVKVKLRQVAKI